MLFQTFLIPKSIAISPNQLYLSRCRIHVSALRPMKETRRELYFVHFTFIPLLIASPLAQKTRDKNQMRVANISPFKCIPTHLSSYFSMLQNSSKYRRASNLWLLSLSIRIPGIRLWYLMVI